MCTNRAFIQTTLNHPRKVVFFDIHIWKYQLKKNSREYFSVVIAKDCTDKKKTCMKSSKWYKLYYSRCFWSFLYPLPIFIAPRQKNRISFSDRMWLRYKKTLAWNNGIKAFIAYQVGLFQPHKHSGNFSILSG